jgi:DNA polymerase/3'-5' exonuclease PolX
MNEQICVLFEQMYNLRIRQGKKFNADAYKKVVPIIRNYPKQIESGAEAQRIVGIGQKIAGNIDEILRTGTLSELNEVINIMTPEDTAKEKVLKLFETIEGVGQKTSAKWYDAGYRQLSDIPLNICTTKQLIGIQLHHELIQRIPRSEVEQFEKIFASYLNPLGIHFIICGSYRRGRPDSGDIDVILLARPDINVMATALQVPIFTHTLSYGDKKYMGVCRFNQLHRRIDLEYVQPHEYPFALLYFTGSKGFNVLMRQRAIDLGATLNEKALSKEYIDVNGIKQVGTYSASTEEEVFALLGLQYLTPEERDKY